MRFFITGTSQGLDDLKHKGGRLQALSSIQNVTG